LLDGNLSALYVHERPLKNKVLVVSNSAKIQRKGCFSHKTALRRLVGEPKPTSEHSFCLLDLVMLKTNLSLCQIHSKKQSR
jgi:hypothetical protein